MFDLAQIMPGYKYELADNGTTFNIPTMDVNLL